MVIIRVREPPWRQENQSERFYGAPDTAKTPTLHMCGLVGIFSVDGESVDPIVLQRMTDLQRHRGPDDQGIRLFSLRHGRSREWRPGTEATTAEEFEGGLGFNRLSILDLSSNGHQPMCSEDGSVILVFNGEIYNAFDHRPDLEVAGYRFRSRTDTEVVLCLYQHYGLDGMLTRLNGMFAFCLVDLRKQKIFLARDRLGIKPLYWLEGGRTILFSSEVKSFLRFPGFSPEIDSRHIDEFLTFRYCAEDRHLLRGVRQVKPGHWLRLDSGGIEQRRYWRIPDGGSPGDMEIDKAADLLEQKLQLSIQRRLLSDAPVGCQLSGGIDSSLVNLFASRKHGVQLDAFSVVLDDPIFSEEDWIDQAVHLTGVRSHKSTLTADFFVGNLERATWHLDQPLNHPHSVGLLLLAEHASRHVKVLLSGEGADELLGGYARFLYALLRPQVGPALPFLRYLPGPGRALNSRLGPAHEDDSLWFIMASAFSDRQGLGRLRPDSTLSAAQSSRKALFARGRGSYLSNCLKYEMSTYLTDLLIKQDKMTMAHSVENRVPFLDHELVELVRTVMPTSLLVSKRLRWQQMPCEIRRLWSKRSRDVHFDAPFVYRQKAGFGIR